MRLSSKTAAHLPEAVACPQYDRSAQKTGIVHFGIGAFHRAHQAVYTDDAMNAGDQGWSITGVSLRSSDVARQMQPQDGLYTVTERSADRNKTRLIGSVREVLVAPENPQAVIAALASPDTLIVSFTVTEKGYCRLADGSLDPDLAAGTIYAYLAAAFRARKAAGLPGLTLLSCDNLTDNGGQLERLTSDYLDHHSPDVSDWFGNNCTCPSSMVDRIVPATTSDDRADVANAIGMQDEAAVITEPFRQWVIEDNFAGPRPRWETAGAQFTQDVSAYETAKLRMLNGAHSALAYLGLARGHEFVHQAVIDPELAPLIEQLMLREAAGSFSTAPGQDLSAYAAALMARFQNSALNHRLMQIAMDGSQKIPQRWLETLNCHQRHGETCPAILTALASWIRHVRGDNGVVDDPMADRLSAICGQSDDVVAALFGNRGLFAKEWIATPDDGKRLKELLG